MHLDILRQSSDTKAIFYLKPSKKFRSIQQIAFHRLRVLHSATELRDLQSLPGNKLEKLKGNRKGQYSIRINDQYRICFEWIDGDAYNVEIVDYH